ncbi:MAG: PH domain-containing protein [Candidatus Nanohaloarchaea archaeon]
MDLPKTVHPSPFAPDFAWRYAWPLGLSLLVLIVTLLGAGYLKFLPFSPYYLALLSLLPLLKVAQVEVERRDTEYEFHRDRVIIQEGIQKVEQKDVLYDKVTDVHSTTTPWEELFDVGNLEISVAGQDRPFVVVGIKEPQKYEDLIMGDFSSSQVEDVRQELEDLERQYENGEIGRAEYEQNYYYLKGKLDALEEG